MSRFRDTYGPWALVAGASEGLGACFARAAAARGLHPILVARREDPLDAIADELRHDHGVEPLIVPLDLAREDAWPTLRDAIGARAVGLLIYNAATIPRGRFLDHDREELCRALYVNCRGPLVLTRELGARMAARGRGGIVLVTSLAGLQGTPLFAAYGATKAFEQTLAEALWDELGRDGVDVLACCAGATRTPGFVESDPRGRVPVMEPADVVAEALAALGRGPTVVAGRSNRVAGLALSRVLPRRLAVRIMGRSTRTLYGDDGRGGR